MDNRIKTWLTLVAVGTVLGFVALLVARSARVHEAFAWVMAISIFLNLFMAGMVGNARNAAQRANEVMAAMYDRMEKSIKPEPVYIEPPRATTFEIQEYPAEEHRPRPVHEAERIGRESDEAERLKREEEYRKNRKPAGFTQGHHSPTPSINGWYRGVDGQYRQRRR